MAIMTHDVRTTQRGIVVVAGSFTGAGTSAPTDVRGDGFAASRIGAGNYGITLDKVYPQLVSYSLTIEGATRNDVDVQIDDDAVSSTGIVEIDVYERTGGTAHDLATGERCGFILVLRDTAV